MQTVLAVLCKGLGIGTKYCYSRCNKTDWLHNTILIYESTDLKWLEKCVWRYSYDIAIV